MGSWRLAVALLFSVAGIAGGIFVGSLVIESDPVMAGTLALLVSYSVSSLAWEVLKPTIPKRERRN